MKEGLCKTVDADSLILISATITNQEIAEEGIVDIYIVTERQNQQVKQNKIKMWGP